MSILKTNSRRQSADAKKNTKGFTLVEVIISIAALGLICAVLLRLFVLAGDTNDAAADSQSAQQLAGSAIETLVCADTIGTGLETLLRAEPDNATDEDLSDYTTNDVIYEKQTDAGLLNIDIMHTGGSYPGTLYTIYVFVQDEDGNELAGIETKKYEQRAAAQCQSYAGAHQ